MKNDLINRRAALEALDEINAEIEDGDGFDFEKWRKYFCDLPSAQPDWNEMMVICDCCGHAIHVKRQ